MKIGSFVWYANKISEPNAEIEEYGTPVKITLRNNYFTCQPATSGGMLAVMEYGGRVSKTWICKANERIFNGKIKAGDLMWVDGDYPNGEDCLYSANATVVNVDTVSNTMTIVLEKNQTEE